MFAISILIESRWNYVQVISEGNFKSIPVFARIVDGKIADEFRSAVKPLVISETVTNQTWLFSYRYVS